MAPWWPTCSHLTFALVGRLVQDGLGGNDLPVPGKTAALWIMPALCTDNIYLFTLNICTDTGGLPMLLLHNGRIQIHTTESVHGGESCCLIMKEKGKAMGHRLNKTREAP